MEEMKRTGTQPGNLNFRSFPAPADPPGSVGSSHFWSLRFQPQAASSLPSPGSAQPASGCLLVLAQGLRDFGGSLRRQGRGESTSIGSNFSQDGSRGAVAARVLAGTQGLSAAAG